MQIIVLTEKISENGWQLTWNQLIFTCSKSTIETLERGVKYVQS